ncbi:MAG TPA: hypothetical protein VJX92_14655 [Methylomirabilota bacterium]|nr:hypothetical protein [Methylomirabilota bacterium]
MATLAELAEYGLASMADALPTQVGPEPVEVLSPAVAVELHDLRTRAAGMANPPRELFLALYDGAEPELFTTVEAARECCDDLAQIDAHGKCWDWLVNEFGIHVQIWTHPDDDRPMGETSGNVTPIVVQGAEPLSELEGLRARVAELEAQLAVKDRTVDEDPIAFVLTDRADGIARLNVPLQALREDEDVSPQVGKLRALLAGQRADVEGEHYAVVHHDYDTPRDMPETDGAK